MLETDRSDEELGFELFITKTTKIKEEYAGAVSGHAEKDKEYRLLEEEIRHKDNNAMIDPGEQRSKFNFNLITFLWQAAVSLAYMSVIISISSSCTSFILDSSN